MDLGLENLYLKNDGKRRRISSYDRKGGNDDRFHIKSNETREFATIEGSGIIKHIWITVMSDSLNRPQETNLYRKVYLSFYWDDETNPSVLVPLGDFFGMGHAMTKNYCSAPLQMGPEDGKGLNSWWPMPFKKKARLCVTNECNDELLFYFYVDYEEREISDNSLYFHAIWHREVPTKGITEDGMKHNEWCFEGENLDGKENYVILEAKGCGHYCGCNINIHNLNLNNQWDWPGEGDDMIFIDGDKIPTLNGTGTEDYVNMSWCPQQEYCAPYHGLILGGKNNWKGKISYYRYHILDPIMFEKDIKVTIEHGHANHRSDDWCTTAYWYQCEPHLSHSILPVDKRLPIDEMALEWDGIIKFENR